jgi:hypothetical protein
MEPAKPWNLSGPYQLEKEVDRYGSEEEGRKEAGSQEGRQEEEVTTSSIVS